MKYIPANNAYGPIAPRLLTRFSDTICDTPVFSKTVDIGIIIATVPVLLTKAPINEVAYTTKMKALVSLPLANCEMLLPTVFANPVCSMAPPTTNSHTIIMTIGDENPLNASLVVRIPVAVSTMRADKATISPRTLPHINMAIVTIKTIIVMVMINKK